MHVKQYSNSKVCEDGLAALILSHMHVHKKKKNATTVVGTKRL